MKGDFDGDGCDDILVGLRGPVQGVWMFHCESKTDLSKWSFFPVSLDQQYGASQLATNDFDNDGKLGKSLQVFSFFDCFQDFAATGFPGFPGSGGTGNHYVAVYYQV